MVGYWSVVAGISRIVAVVIVDVVDGRCGRQWSLSQSWLTEEMGLMTI